MLIFKDFTKTLYSDEFDYSLYDIYIDGEYQGSFYGGELKEKKEFEPLIILSIRAYYYGGIKIELSVPSIKQLSYGDLLLQYCNNMNTCKNCYYDGSCPLKRQNLQTGEKFEEQKEEVK